MTRSKSMEHHAKLPVIPKLRFPEFRDELGFEETTLGQLSEVLRGGSPRPIDDYLTKDIAGLNWLKIGDVPKDSKYVTQTEERVRIEALSKSRKVNPGDLILSNSMSFGRPYILRIESCIHDGWIAVTQIDGRISTDYLYYAISSPRSQVFFEDNAAGGGVRNLNADIIKSLLVAYPCRAEQQKIAECLSALDELIGAISRKFDALKAHKKGLMQHLFPDEGETLPRLRFPEFQGVGDWERKPLATLIEIASGQIDPTVEPYCNLLHVGGENIESHTGNLQYVRSARDDAVISGKYLFDERDVLYSKIRPALNKVSAPNFRGVCSADIYPVRPSSSELIREHLLYLLRSESFVSYAVKHSERGKIPKINRDALLGYCATLPKPAEQRRITSFLSSLDDLIAAQAAQLDTLKVHRQGLMQQLFPAPVEAEA